MKELILQIKKLRNLPIKETIDSRMSDFSSLWKESSQDLFKELCFCLLTANFSAHRGILIQNAINDGFLHFDEKELAQKLAELGHRFPNTRAKYIFNAREHSPSLKETLSQFQNGREARLWLAKNIKGLGFKESSHFLRNIGFKDVAIIDFHIVDLLVKHDLIEKPKSRALTPKKYEEIEDVLQKLCNSVGLSQGELDLYLWYEETGKILK